jgi:uncharacterized membrane protein YdjX (TVP38/TMEM64 family)
MSPRLEGTPGTGDEERPTGAGAVTRSHRSREFTYALGLIALALLAWQGHHLAHWLPAFERTIEILGPWGPAAYCVSFLLLGPLLVPDTLFGLAAGAAFGLVLGTACYFAAAYAMCLGVQWLAGRWLRSRVLPLLETRSTLRTLMAKATARGVRFTFLVRLLPINQALVSYALGADGIRLRDALVGNLGMFTHMLPTVYFGAAAVHVTRMAGTRHQHWEIDGLLLVLGLGLCVGFSLWISRRAWAAITQA